MSIDQQIQNLNQSIAQVAKECGRQADAIKLIAVTKTVDSARIGEAFNAGLRDFGENRVQELLEKMPQLPQDIRWHLIGHLQTNKVKQVIGKVELIHSLDRPELLVELEKQAKARGIEQVDCLVQVNSSGESSKYGFLFEEVSDFVASISNDSPVKIKGLMTIGPLTDDVEQVRKAFVQTKALLEELKVKYPNQSWDILSMGMSGDYLIAIEEGSTMLRVGSTLFGKRM